MYSQLVKLSKLIVEMIKKDLNIFMIVIFIRKQINEYKEKFEL